MLGCLSPLRAAAAHQARHKPAAMKRAAVPSWLCHSVAPEHGKQQLDLKPRPVQGPAGSKTAAGFKSLSIHPVWPANYTKKLEQKTLDRAHEADTVPSVYDFKLWSQHRSSWRFIQHLLLLGSSHILQDLSGPVLTITAIAAAVGLYETSLEAGNLPGSFSWPNIALGTSEPFNLTSFALSLMLVFRTNTSYARWLEARILWGSLTNKCRNFARLVLVLVPAEQWQLRAAMLRWMTAFPFTVKAHLREDGDIMQELKGMLTSSELNLVGAANNKPLLVLQVLAGLVQQVRVDPIATARLDENLSSFEDILGACERILRTPIPLSYTRHTSRFLTLWLTFLPFSLWEKVHWYVVPATALVGFLLTSIDQIAIHLEEPFGILPLEAFCQNIRNNLEELSASDRRVTCVVNWASADISQLQTPGATEASVDGLAAWDGAVADCAPADFNSLGCWNEAGSMDGNDVGHWAALPLPQNSTDVF